MLARSDSQATRQAWPDRAVGEARRGPSSPRGPGPRAV